MNGAPARRQVVRALVKRGVSQTRACAAVELSRSSFRYKPSRSDDVELIERIKEIRDKKPRWGYRRVHARLKSEGFTTHGKPVTIRSDSGPEFIAFELTEWLESQGATTHHIEPGKPWQNSFAESFNSRVRDECLNMKQFWSVEHARVVLEAWRIEFNTEHPHSSLGYNTPAQFAASWGAP